MLDTLGIDGGTLILIIALVSILAYPTIFVHLYAARKLDEAKRREAQDKNPDTVTSSKT